MSTDSRAEPVAPKPPAWLRPPFWEVFPDELKAPDRKQWVLWYAVWIDGNNGMPGRWSKQPHQPPCLSNGRWRIPKAATTRPETWSFFSEVAIAAERYENFDGPQPFFDGIGFVFTQEDPYLGIDLDHAVDAGGAIEPWAQKILDHFRSYAEFSVSGHGIHIIIKGKLPERVRHKKAWGTGEIELYDKLRYFTMSGHVVPGTPGAHINERQAELDSFLRDYDILPAPGLRPAPHQATGGARDCERIAIAPQRRGDSCQGARRQERSEICRPLRRWQHRRLRQRRQPRRPRAVLAARVLDRPGRWGD